eukprot:364337-Chlamydomonas_euryale.AAC.9
MGGCASQPGVPNPLPRKVGGRTRCRTQQENFSLLSEIVLKSGLTAWQPPGSRHCHHCGRWQPNLAALPCTCPMAAMLAIQQLLNATCARPSLASAGRRLCSPLFPLPITVSMWLSTSRAALSAWLPLRGHPVDAGTETSLSWHAFTNSPSPSRALMRLDGTRHGFQLQLCKLRVGRSGCLGGVNLRA